MKARMERAELAIQKQRERQAREKAEKEKAEAEANAAQEDGGGKVCNLFFLLFIFSSQVEMISRLQQNLHLMINLPRRLKNREKEKSARLG